MRAGDLLWDKNLLRDTFSFSKLNTYAKCPQRAKYRYIDGRKESGLHLARGRAGHAGQEIDNRAKLRGERLSVSQILEAAVGVLKEELETEPSMEGRPGQRGVEVDTFTTDHRVCLEVFEESGERGRVLPVEGTVEAPFEMQIEVEGEPARIQGFVDLLSRDRDRPEGDLTVVDYKTVKRPVSVGDAEKSLQFELYRIAAGARGARVISFVESGRQRATTKVVETPPRSVGTGPTSTRLLNWMARTIKSFRRSIETGDWPRCSPESYWCSPSACGFYGECYPKRVPERLIQVGEIKPPGSMPQPGWREIHGGAKADVLGSGSGGPVQHGREDTPAARTGAEGVSGPIEMAGGQSDS